jgi:flagellar hook assembly protein FlgD
LRADAIKFVRKEETLSASHEPRMPETFKVYQNYPNPFKSCTQISFIISKQSRVIVSIYNVIGKLVLELLNRDYIPGSYNVNWNGTNVNNMPVSSGIYFYSVITNFAAITKKMILLR